MNRVQEGQPSAVFSVLLGPARPALDSLGRILGKLARLGAAEAGRYTKFAGIVSERMATRYRIKRYCSAVYMVRRANWN